MTNTFSKIVSAWEAFESPGISNVWWDASSKWGYAIHDYINEHHLVNETVGSIISSLYARIVTIFIQTSKICRCVKYEHVLCDYMHEIDMVSLFTITTRDAQNEYDEMVKDMLDQNT